MRSVVVTDDGSHTIDADGVTYHSLHGAITESRHVFIHHGLEYLRTFRQEISVLEVGFGTGLNALLTYLFSRSNPDIRITYLAVEQFPLEQELVSQLNYLDLLGARSSGHVFHAMHDQHEFEESNFTFRLRVEDITDLRQQDESVDLVYFDAFGPNDQPGMWDISTLRLVAQHIRNGGALVTYCAQGQFKRNLRTLGFEIESLPGPPGKREMVRAVRKPIVSREPDSPKL